MTARRGVLRWAAAAGAGAWAGPQARTPGDAGTPALAGVPPRPLRPGRRLHIRSAYPPGGVSDTVLRALAAQLSQRLGVPVLVEHWPGAGGTLAMESLTRVEPDGQVLVFSATSPLTVSPHWMRLGYDAQRDIAALSAVMVVPLLVAGTSALPAQGLVAALRRPEALRWASSGVGTTGHLALEAVRQASGAAIVHVPYKGGGQQINDALAGHFELLSTNVAPPQLAWVQAGRLRALAVGAPQRLRHLPQVATLAELGFASANLASTFGLFAPAATPPQRLAALHQQVDAVLAEPAWQQQLLAAEHLPLRWSRAAFSAHVAEESRQRAQQVKQLGAALADDPA